MPTHTSALHWLVQLAEARGFAGADAVIVNPSVILGAWNWHEGATKMFRMVWKGGLKFYTLGGNGYVDVRDVARCMIQLMKNGVSAQRFILNSENLTYKQIFEQIAARIPVVLVE